MRGPSTTRALVVAVGAVSLVGYAVGFPRVAAAAVPLRAYVALFLTLYALYALAVAAVLRHGTADPRVLVLVLGFGLLFRVVLLPTPVVLSSDVYRYLWDGRVQAAGLSPYRYPPAAPELAPLRDPTVFPAINRPTVRTVYPPGAQALFRLVFGLAPDGLLAWRVFLFACEAAMAALLIDLLRRMDRPPSAVIIYAWAPLAVFETVQAGHLEAPWLVLLLLALRWRQTGRPMRAGLALGGAVLLKLYPAVMLIAWWRRGERRLATGCLALVTAGYLLYLRSAGPMVLGFLPHYFGSGEDFNIGLRFFLTGWIPLAAGSPREAVRGITMLALFGLLAGVLRRIARRRTEDPVGVFGAAMAAAGAYLLLVPTALHAWYVLWILPFLTVRPSPGWLWFTGAVSLSYLAYVGEPGFPFWARASEFLPLYGLLLWEWRSWPRLGAVLAPGAPRVAAAYPE